MYTTGRVHGRVHEHLQSSVRAVYMVRVYGCVLAVYTAVYMARTRPCNGDVHMRVYTAVYTAVNGPCTRPRTDVHEHLQSRGRAVYMARVYGCVLAVYTAAYAPCRTV